MKKLLLALLALFPVLLAAQITPNLQLNISVSKSTVDVRDYGVKCDGSANDSTAMNNAFAAAVAVGTSRQARRMSKSRQESVSEISALCRARG